MTQVLAANTIYVPTQASTTVNVTASPPATPVVVNYSPAIGSLALTIVGPPGGAAASVLVAGPGGFNQVVTASHTWTNLTAGIYTVIGHPVTMSNVTYAAAGFLVTVPASPPAVTATVTYVLASGWLTLTVVGPPGGASANVSVTGPAGFSQVVTASQTLADLTPGAYVVAGLPVLVSNVPYAAPAATVHVTASLTPATTTLTYAIATGSLVFTASGLPEGTNDSASVTGPAGFSQVAHPNQVLAYLAPGTYTITPLPVVDWYATYTAPSTTLAVAASLGTASITYVYGPVLQLPQGTVGSEYGGCNYAPFATYCGYELGVAGGRGAPSWSWKAAPGSSLPPGVALHYQQFCGPPAGCGPVGTELITGRPTLAGTYSVVISATKGTIVTSHTFTITIN